MTFDYKNQAWVSDEGKYMRCNHPKNMNCTCYGKLHEGEKASPTLKDLDEYVSRTCD